MAGPMSALVYTAVVRGAEVVRGVYALGEVTLPWTCGLIAGVLVLVEMLLLRVAPVSGV
jgi:hypothetical protein